MYQYTIKIQMTNIDLLSVQSGIKLLVRKFLIIQKSNIKIKLEIVGQKTSSFIHQKGAIKSRKFLNGSYLLCSIESEYLCKTII